MEKRLKELNDLVKEMAKNRGMAYHPAEARIVRYSLEKSNPTVVEGSPNAFHLKPPRRLIKQYATMYCDHVMIPYEVTEADLRDILSEMSKQALEITKTWSIEVCTLKNPGEGDMYVRSSETPSHAILRLYISGFKNDA